MRVAIDATNALVAGGVLLIAGVGSWLVVGSYLVWALWQVVAFYSLLLGVAAAVYGALFLAVRGETESTLDRVVGD